MIDPCAGGILHFDGSTWNATGPNDIWAAGKTGVGGIIHHYDGTAWSIASTEQLPFLNGIHRAC